MSLLLKKGGFMGGGGIAPVEILSVTNATISEFSPPPTTVKVAGYELQGDGNTYSITNEDDNTGPPTFIAINMLTDWINIKSFVGVYHARMTNIGGSTSLSSGSAPLNVWLLLGVDSTIWTIEESAGSMFQDWIGTIEVSDDGGSTTEDSATITLETDET